MDIKQRLQQMVDSKDLSYVGAATVAELCKEAVEEIERNEETIRTLQLHLDMARSAVRSQSPEVVQLTRHTITLQRPIPALEVGDSIILIVAPTR